MTSTGVLVYEVGPPWVEVLGDVQCQPRAPARSSGAGGYTGGWGSGLGKQVEQGNLQGNTRQGD